MKTCRRVTDAKAACMCLLVLFLCLGESVRYSVYSCLPRTSMCVCDCAYMYLYNWVLDSPSLHACCGEPGLVDLVFAFHDFDRVTCPS